MSLDPSPIEPVPQETARVARAIFPKGNRYLLLRDTLGTLFTDPLFADLFSTRGQPALAPWRLALVTLVQHIEGLPDRQAAEAVRTRIDLKYLLGLSLVDPGFDFSVRSQVPCPIGRARLCRAVVGRPAGSVPEERVACRRRTSAHGLHPCARAGPSAQPDRPGGRNGACRAECPGRGGSRLAPAAQPA